VTRPEPHPHTHPAAAAVAAAAAASPDQRPAVQALVCPTLSNEPRQRKPLQVRCVSRLSLPASLRGAEPSILH
ncbi:unnamed protein product, partial [Urochloa humidicola]